MITTQTNPGRLNTMDFTVGAATVAIEGVTYHKGTGIFPRGFYSLDSAQHFANCRGGIVVRFGCCFAVALDGVAAA